MKTERLCQRNGKKTAQDMARRALMDSVDNPESVKNVGISKLDSVFGCEYVTMKEKMALSVALENQPPVYGEYGF